MEESVRVEAVKCVVGFQGAYNTALVLFNLILQSQHALVQHGVPFTVTFTPILGNATEHCTQKP